MPLIQVQAKVISALIPYSVVSVCVTDIIPQDALLYCTLHWETVRRHLASNHAYTNLTTPISRWLPCHCQQLFLFISFFVLLMVRLMKCVIYLLFLIGQVPGDLRLTRNGNSSTSYSYGRLQVSKDRVRIC